MMLHQDGTWSWIKQPRASDEFRLQVALWNSNPEFEILEAITKSYVRLRRNRCSSLVGKILVRLKK